MKLSFKPQHLKRYREIAQVLAKFGFSEAVRASGLEELLGKDNVLSKRAHPEPRELAEDLERMGPTFVKLGQTLSTRADIVPLRYLDALTDLQDKVGPFPFEDVARTVHEELGLPIERAFASFERTPLAAASLGQVHRAVLHDGRKVAVKVQRPAIRARLVEDLDVLDEVAGMLEAFSHAARRYEVRRIVEDFRRTLLRELDYEQEARNLETLRANLAGYEHIVVPLPVESHTTSRVLTMDFIDGKKITALPPEERSRLGGASLAEELLGAYIQQICIDGFFHADPHPGNVLCTPDGKLALLDLGMVSLIMPATREHLLRLLLAVGEGRGEEAADLAEKIGEPKEEFDESKLRRDVCDLVARQQGANVGQVELGKAVLEIARIAGDSGWRMPGELTLLGKALMNLDQIGRLLAPEFDPYRSIRRGAPGWIVAQVRKGVSVSGTFLQLLEVQELAKHLPARINKILDRAANNRLEIRVKTFDEQRLLEGFQKIANRIAQGVVIAAMVIGASLLLQVKPAADSFTIYGYPGFAILLFLAAAAGGVALTWDIFRHDRRARS
jgi:predicted unusual protein kinase regulating ubiquinone biosynthesis (AarF/ABC1/UbiB family)